MTETTTTQPEHDWQEAGDAWGHAATDWACLYEHYSIDALIAILQRVGPIDASRMLDIACGSGLGMRLAAGMGADMAGLDAAASLLEIAQARNPSADIRLGSMFDLPWKANSFDAAVSVNGIWGGCEQALVEANRVLRPGGKIGISFWGGGPPNDLRGAFKAFARHAPQEHFGSMKKLNSIGTPGVAEDMLTAAGFDVIEQGSRVSTVEWPDAEMAWRALSSIGPAVPALRHTDPTTVKGALLEAIEPCRDKQGIYRFRNDHQFVIARKPVS